MVLAGINDPAKNRSRVRYNATGYEYLKEGDMTLQIYYQVIYKHRYKDSFQHDLSQKAKLEELKHELWQYKR